MSVILMTRLGVSRCFGALTDGALTGLILLCLVAMPVIAAAQEAVVESHAFLQEHKPATQMPSAEPPAAVQELLAQMTLKEKVGQMTQLELSMVADGKGPDIQINPEKLRKAVVEYGVGSLLNVFDETLTIERWHDIIGQVQAMAAESRLKVPVLYGIDSIHGANYITGATLFPQPLGMASTWNPELMLEGSRITAAETRAAGIPWNFSPVLDIGRMPLWPRLYETFGEDAYLATVMGVASVRGYEGDDLASPNTVASCMKHYIGYSYPTTGHDRTPALIPEVVLREHFLPSFRAAVEAGAHTVMVNSGEVNGIPGHANRYLLEEVLRGELGFEGLIVTDWEDIKKMVQIHRTAADEKAATKESVLAGIDMSMVPSDYSFSDLLLELVEEGAIPESRIDQSVRRILTLKHELGLFENPTLGVESGVQVGSAEHRQAALESARESVILLKNEGGLLPLAPGAKLLVTGPTADSLLSLNNGWTWTWQGERESAYPTDRHTVKQALEEQFGAASVTYVPGATYDEAVDLEAAAEAAAAADVVVLCLGEMSYAETPGNIDDLALPPAQQRLAKAVAAAGNPVVMVLVEGRPRLIRDIADDAGAIVLAFNPGLEGGTALAEVLAGAVNPSGKLPVTYPRQPHALRTYDHKAFEAIDTQFGLKAYQPQYPFGHGLSYTEFEYSDLRINTSGGAVTLGEAIEISVTVRNSGSRSGAEVVQLYLSDHVASVTPPVKRLKRFAKVPLGPGESRTVSFRLEQADLAFVGRDFQPTAEPGDFTVTVGDQRASFELVVP